MSELDKDIDDSRDWVNETLQWIYPCEDALAKQARADSLVEALALLRNNIHSLIRRCFKLEDRVKALAEENETLLKQYERLGVVEEKVADLDRRLSEFDKYVLESRIHPLESRVAKLERGHARCS